MLRLRLALISVGAVVATSMLVAACSSDEDDDGSTQGTGASGASGSGASGNGASGSGASGSGASGGGTSVGGAGSGGSPDGGAGVGGGTGGAGQGGEGQGGGDPGEVCGECLEPLTKGNGACVTEFEACDADNACTDWFDCIDECAKNDWTATCLDACDAASPDAAALFGALVTCTCQTCANDCGPFCG